MKKTENYFEKHSSEMNKLISESAFSFTTEDFHQLRVEIKRIKALTELINFCSDDFKKKKSFRPFKKIFRQAGTVRDFQLEEKALKKSKFKPSDNYFKALQNRITKEKKRMNNIIDKKFKSDLKRKQNMIKSFAIRIKKTCTIGYFKATRNNLATMLFAPALNIENVHAVRKKLKELFYNEKCMRLIKGKKQSSGIKAFQELLGNWHDARIIMKSMGNVLKRKTLSVGDKKKLHHLRLEKISESEKLFNKINAVRKSAFVIAII
jgi:CHAD domain-containing protein